MSREDELRQKAEEFATRAAAATNDEERVELVTVVQAYTSLPTRRRRKAARR
jgi:hypothetical protein